MKPSFTGPPSCALAVELKPVRPLKSKVTLADMKTEIDAARMLVWRADSAYSLSGASSLTRRRYLRACSKLSSW